MRATKKITANTSEKCAAGFSLGLFLSARPTQNSEGIRPPNPHDWLERSCL